MPIKKYAEIVSDPDTRTALSGMLGREFWNIASESIWDAFQKWCDEKPEHRGADSGEGREFVKSAEETLSAPYTSRGVEIHRLRRELIAAIEFIDRQARELAAAKQGLERLREALLGHRWDLHHGSKRPCPTCRQSADALGLKVPDQCARRKVDEAALDQKGG
jgi:hypothetical protein